MKSISAELLAHFQQRSTTLATLYKLTPKHPFLSEIGFTTHNKDLLYLGLNYSGVASYVPSSVDSTAELSVDNLEIEATFDALGITQASVEAGYYDFASLALFMVNHQDLSMGHVGLRRGFIGEIDTIDGFRFRADFMGLNQRLRQPQGEVYTPTCRADLGDTSNGARDDRCGVDLTPFIYNGSVTSVLSRRLFNDSSQNDSNGWFALGKLTWLTGNNTGFEFDIKDSGSSGDLELYEASPFEMQIGDTYSIYPGCNKTRDICRDKFDNVPRFRGEPFVPTKDKAYAYVT